MRKYSRVLLKISGEALMGSSEFAHDLEVIQSICTKIKDVYDAGYQVSMVVGGGNICRGELISQMGIQRATGDNMGMLATVINALAMQSILESMKVPTRVQSAITMTSITEPYIGRRAARHMEKKRAVIFAAGTGNPFFTTDTAAILRAIESQADVVVKCTQVDGVYSSDPRKNKDAKFFDSLSYIELVTQNLRVMDMSAVSLAMENSIPIIVCKLSGDTKLTDALEHKGKFTLIHEG